MKTIPALLAAASLATVTGCMTTAERNEHRVAGGATPIFQKLDTNNDGKVTYAEFDAGFTDVIFDTYNLNGTGAITKQEWNGVEKAHQDEAAATFRALDLNHDGKITKEELNTRSKRRNAVVRRLFNAVDANHDGVLSLQEAQRFGINRAADRDPANHP